MSERATDVTPCGFTRLCLVHGKLSRRGQLGTFVAQAINFEDDSVVIPQISRLHGDGGKMWPSKPGEDTPRSHIVAQMAANLEMMGLCVAEDGSVCVHPEVLEELDGYRSRLVAYVRRVGWSPPEPMRAPGARREGTIGAPCVWSSARPMMPHETTTDR